MIKLLIGHRPISFSSFISFIVGNKTLVYTWDKKLKPKTTYTLLLDSSSKSWHKDTQTQSIKRVSRRKRNRDISSGRTTTSAWSVWHPLGRHYCCWRTSTWTWGWSVHDRRSVKPPRCDIRNMFDLLRWRNRFQVHVYFRSCNCKKFHIVYIVKTLTKFATCRFHDFKLRGKSEKYKKQW